MEKKKMDKSTLIVLIFIAVVVVAVIGYGIYSSMQPDSTPTPSTSSTPAVSDNADSQPNPNQPNESVPSQSQPASSASASSAAPQSKPATSKPYQFTTPAFVTKYLNLDLKAHFGYIPKEDFMMDGGKYYVFENVAVGYNPYDDYTKPVGLVTSFSEIFPDKSQYTYSELKQMLGSKLSELAFDEYNGSGYVCTITHDGYRYFMEIDDTMFYADTNVKIGLDYGY
ncbi:MAG: hypothetical protein IKT68_05430 [Clostridia bacterium]|nr:hypothetical protein [Clostridia bacterium]